MNLYYTEAKMDKLKNVIKFEFYRYFTTPLALVYLICFIFLNGSCTFFLGNFFERGNADLLPMFNYIPWLFLLFVPAIAMRMWAEEFKSRTILQILTLPISIPTLVWGKFLASWIFCLIALLFTTPLWFSVNVLGKPDNGLILAGYIACFILSGAMIAISQTMSALTKNQVIALVLGVLANLLFFLSGIEFVLGNIRNFVSMSVADIVASFSFLTHFNSFCMGVLELRNIVFFITIILLFNIFTIIIISYKTLGGATIFKSSNRTYYMLVCIFVSFAFLGINTLSNIYLRHIKIDFTEEKIFTLTEASEKVIKNIKGHIYAKLYYSPLLAEKNPELRLLINRIQLLLEQYSRLSNGKISVKKYNPEPFSDAEDRALAAGLQPLPIINKNQNAYLGLVLTDEYNNQQVIPFFPLARSNFIEQDLTEAFYLLNRNKPRLGIITSLPMFEDTIENVVTSEWEISKQLSRFYDVYKLSQNNPDLSNIDALIIAHPSDLTDKAIENIKKFSLNGGKILAFFDTATEAQQIFSPTTSNFKPSNYKDLPQTWGIRFVEQAVVADLDNSSLVDATENNATNPEFTQDVIQFYLKGNSFNQKSPITANLKKMMLTSASIIVPLKSAQITFEPLLQASDNSALIKAEAVYNRIAPAVILRNFKADTNPKYIAAHIKGINTPLNIIAVGDSDMLYDSFWTQHQLVLDNSYAIPILDNANFVLNALDFLLEDSTLLSLRGKNYFERKFLKLEKDKIEAAKNFKIKEKEIFDDLAKAKAGITEITQKRNFEGRDIFTPDELAIIAKIRKQINSDRQRLYDIRTQIDEKSSKLKTILIAINIYFLPIFGILLLLLPLITKHNTNKIVSKFSINKSLLYIIILGTVFLASGLLALREYELKFIDQQENKLIFPDLSKNINNLKKIVLKNNSKELIFEKDNNGKWILPQYPFYLVYQARIRNLLANLITATYYEKKSSGFDTLKNFGLSPIEDASSSAVEITLLDNQNKQLEQIYVGNLDIELGRGSRGAYIRKNNSFQVWLAQMDLIDLNLDSQNWTYSSIWNLQFGRFIKVNQNTNPDVLANLAKELINTFFSGAKKDIKLSNLILTLNLNVERNNSLILNFYEENGTYWVEYKFNNIDASETLQDFAASVKDVFYEISATDMEKIKNASSNFIETGSET